MKQTVLAIIIFALPAISAYSQHQIPEYRVGPGDILSIQVFGVPQFDQTARVSNSGRTNIRYVGVVSVAGMTVAEIEKAISRELVERKLVNDPWLRVQVAEYNAQPVFVVGEVTAPGQFIISGEMHLLDVITRAGGLTENAGEEGILIRRLNNTRIDVAVSSPMVEHLAAPVSSDDLNSSESDERIKVDLTGLTDGSRPAAVRLNFENPAFHFFYSDLVINGYCVPLGTFISVAPSGLNLFSSHTRGSLRSPLATFSPPLPGRTLYVVTTGKF